MSRAPNSAESSSSHTRRRSTHSISVSYACLFFVSPLPSSSTALTKDLLPCADGAPSVGSPGPRPIARPAPSHGSPRAPSVVSGSTALTGGAGGADDESSSGRASEPAAVRYERIRQRTKDTGHPFLPRSPPDPPLEMAQAQIQAQSQSQSQSQQQTSGRNDTSVNIATAFREATRGHGGVVQGQRREREYSVAHEERDKLMNGGDGDGEGDKETHLAQASPSVSKKRKVRPSLFILILLN